MEINENVDQKKAKNVIRKCKQSINTANPKGITLVALVITIIIIIILSTIAINFTFGENGLITRAEQAKELAEVSTIQEQMEMIKAEEIIEGQGTIDPDRYFDKLEDAGVILDKDTDVIDNGDGTYEVTADPDYVFDVTLVPDKENPTDLEIEYVGKGEVIGPRIRRINITEQTENSISVEVETRDAEGGTYTYSYRKEGEPDWIDAATNNSNTYKFEGLESSTTYEIKVKVETEEGTAEKKTKVTLGAPEVAPEGTITFGEVAWSGYKASVTVNTSAEGYTIEYQVNKQEEGSWQTVENNGTIPNLNHGDTVYARITDGSKTSGVQETEIADTKNPTVVVKANGTTSSSVSVTVQAVDNESGMKDDSTYTYSIKESTQGDETYTTPENANGITNTSYTFTGLMQGTNYTVRVQVNGDKANNVGTGTLADQTTGTVGGASEGLATGNIVATNPTWSSGQASITLTTSTGMQIQWQKNSIEGQWTTIASGGQVTGLSHGDTVFARLTDGTNVGDYASVNIQDGIAPSAPTIRITSGTAGNNGYYKSNVTVTITGGNDGESGANKIRYAVTGAQTVTQTETADGNTSTSITISAEGASTITAYTLDKAGNVSTAATQTINKDSTAPSTASLTVGTVGETSIAVTARGADSTSGIYSYQFQRSTTSATSGFTTVGGTQTSTATSYSYTYSNLTDDTTYYLRVVVTDRAGNTTTSTAVTQKTNMTPVPIEDKLKAGDYVYYTDGKGTRRTCVVLYDSSSSYGVEIITMESVEDVELGNGTGSTQSNNTTYFNTAKNSYNNAISTLNSAASPYNNTTYSSRARCVGSNPSNPTLDNPGYYTRSDSWFSSYKGQFKNTDTNYESDFEQMKVLGIHDIDGNYWLASRCVIYFNTWNGFYVRYVDTSGILHENEYVFYVGSDGDEVSVSDTRGLRPIFLLRSNVKVTGGAGEEGDPYTLGT